MLLNCPRHTKADLEFWRELEAADKLRGERKDLDRAIDRIVRFVEEGSCYAATSWGKDSVVMCHLLVRAQAFVPVTHIVQLGPQRDPEQGRVAEAFLSRWPLEYHEVEVDEQIKLQNDTEHSPALDIGIGLCESRWGKRWISGLRGSEGGGRQYWTHRGGGKHSCWPLSDWSADDVFAYLAVHDLPVHPAYAMLGGGRWERERVRVSIIGGAKGRAGGRDEWEREYYGDILRRIEASKRTAHS